MSLVNGTWEESSIDYDIFRDHESFWSKYSNLSLFELFDRETTLKVINELNETERVAYLVTLYNLDPNLRWDTPRYYSFFYKLIGTFFQTIIFLVGLLGNSLVVIVVFKSRSMRTPTNCYLVSLAVADSIVLLSAVPPGIVGYYLIGDNWIFGQWGCKTLTFLQFLGINISALSIGDFTVERYIAICHPMLAHKMCTVRRAKRIIVYTWLFATIYTAPWLILSGLQDIYYVGYGKTFVCGFALRRDSYKLYFFLDMVLFYAAPLIVSLICYALIARILYRSDQLQFTKKTNITNGSNNKQQGCKVRLCFRKNDNNNNLSMDDMRSNSIGQTPNIAVESCTPTAGSDSHLASINNTGLPSNTANNNNNNNSNNNKNCRKQQQQQQHYNNNNNDTVTDSANDSQRDSATDNKYHCSKTPTTPAANKKNNDRSGMKKNVSAANDSSRVQVVKMLAVVVAVFATLWLPYRGMVLYNSFIYPPYKELWFLMFAKTMIFVNSAINPIIYSACSIKFRREFKKMLTCGHKSATHSNSYLRSRAMFTGRTTGMTSRNGSSVSGGTCQVTGTGRSMSGVLVGQPPPPSHSRSMANLRRHSTTSQASQLSENPLRRESSQFLTPHYNPSSSTALQNGYNSGGSGSSSIAGGIRIRSSTSISKLATCSKSVNAQLDSDTAAPVVPGASTTTTTQPAFSINNNHNDQLPVLLNSVSSINATLHKTDGNGAVNTATITTITRPSSLLTTVDGLPAADDNTVTEPSSSTASQNISAHQHSSYSTTTSGAV